MITVTRLTTIDDIVRHWRFLSTGIVQVAHHYRFRLSIDGYRKTLFKLVKQPHTAYIALAADGGIPVGFVVIHECTPLFAAEREFDASIYYHEPGFAHAIRALQAEFEKFCLQNNIRRYFVTTCRKSGRPLHVFGVEWEGLSHAYRVFKKELKT